jgi:hypothetical protein
MTFVKFYRLMSETTGFADSNINSTVLYYFIRKKPIGPTEIRTHDPWIQFQHKNIQRASDHGYSAS